MFVNLFSQNEDYAESWSFYAIPKAYLAYGTTTVIVVILSFIILPFFLLR